MNTASWLLKIGFALIAVVLQIVVAPYIAIGPALPNFLAVYVISLALVAPSRQVFIFAFALGIIFDLIGGGPVGAMAFVLILASAVAAFTYRFLGNDTRFMAFVVVFVGLFLVELGYGLVLLGFGYDASFGSILLYRVVPCAFYDCVLSLAVFPLVSHFLGEKPTTNGIPTASVGVGGS